MVTKHSDAFVLRLWVLPEPGGKKSPFPAVSSSKTYLLSLGVWRKVTQALGFASVWFLGSGRTPPHNILEATGCRSPLGRSTGPDRRHHMRLGRETQSLLGAVMHSHVSTLFFFIFYSF